MKQHFFTTIAAFSRTALLAALLSTIISTHGSMKNPYADEIHWDWGQIDTTTVNDTPVIDILKKHAQKLAAAGKQFLFGAGSSSIQVEDTSDFTKDNCDSWFRFVEKRNEEILRNRAQGKKDERELFVQAGAACDFLNCYPEDIALLKQLGLNTLRLSVNWKRIEPREGEFDEHALAQYSTIIKTLVAHGIKPVITLYHYSEPDWFEDKGSFEKYDNIQYFVRFCKTVFNRLHPDVHLWFTFNSPSSMALQGWYRAERAPGNRDINLALKVMFHILEAHVAVYQELKKHERGIPAQIGVLHNILQLDPWWNPFCSMGNELQSDCLYRFFQTGTFNVTIPPYVPYIPYFPYFCKANEKSKLLKPGQRCMDFIGLNYYCHNYMGLTPSLYADKTEIPTENPRYTIYAEGLYRAIKEIYEKIAQPQGDVPIYVTENGIATHDDAKRTLFFQRTMHALAKAINDGYQVDGYITWALTDNYEWGVYKKKYGLAHVNFADGLLKRTIKDGAEYYSDVAQEVLQEERA